MEAIAVKIRAVAAAALAVALSAGLAGCNMISPQRTTMKYDASDGVSVELGDIALRNVLLITDGEGKQANLVYTAVNRTSEDAKVEIKFDGSSSTAELTHSSKGAASQFGFGEAGPNIVSGDFPTGSTVTPVFTATFTDAQGSTQTVTVDDKAVPVLGDDDAKHILEEYQTLVPMPEPTATPEPAKTPAESTAHEVAEDEAAPAE